MKSLENHAMALGIGLMNAVHILPVVWQAIRSYVRNASLSPIAQT